MNPRQAQSLANPCRSPTDMMRPIHHEVAGEFTTSLAVCRMAALFNGRPIWHATVAAIRAGGDVYDFATLGRPVRRRAAELLDALLDGVGEVGADHIETRGPYLGAKRPLSPAELETVDPAFRDALLQAPQPAAPPEDASSVLVGLDGRPLRRAPRLIVFG